MSIATVGVWLREYQVYDFAGKCTFKYRDVIDFTIEVSADETYLCVSALLAELPEENNQLLLLHLLQLNYLGIETHGACLSIDDTGQHVVLWYGRPVAGLDAELFGNLVGSFLDTAESLQQRIQKDADGNETGVAPPRFDPQQMMRV